MSSNPNPNAILVYNRCVAAKFPDLLSKFITAQSKFESSVAGIPYQSKLFLRSWNSFGYGYLAHDPDQVGAAGRHPEDGGVYAKYVDLDHCMNDIIQWYTRRSSIFFAVDSVNAFALALKASGYYTAPVSQYYAGVLRFFLAGV